MSHFSVRLHGSEVKRPGLFFLEPLDATGGPSKGCTALATILDTPCCTLTQFQLPLRVTGTLLRYDQRDDESDERF